MSTVSDLRKHVAALARECYQFSEDELLEEDITIADMWSGEVYKFYKDTDEVDKIRDRDITHAYQLRPLSAVRKEASISREQEKNSTSQFDSEDTVGVSTLLDTDTLNELDRTWQNKLEEFVQQPMSLYRLTNETRSSKEDKIDFYRKLISFIQRCRKCSDSSAETTGSGGKTMLESNDKLDKISKTKTKKVEEVESPLMLEEQSQMSSTFKNVRTPHDLAVLEYCASKYKSFINSSSAKKKSLNDDGIRVQVVFKKHASTPNGHNAKSRSSWKTVGTAIAMRLPPTLTVSDFRRELGQRISKALKIENEKSSSHSEASFASNGSGPDKLKSSFTSMTPETAILNQVALSYDSKSVSNQNYASSEVIGTVTDEQLISDAAIFAKSTDKEEQELIAEFVEEKGKIFVGWPTRLSDSFDEDALWVKEEFLSEDQKREREQSLENKVTVMECISKYCQIEQLEKSEMWYCNRCKDHVQAWKKFCLYRAPPILIIHLKRFHFSSSTHRRDKIDTLIDFPLKDLDLRDLVMHSEEGKEPIYDCYAVSNHFGGLGGGHYTAYAKGDDGIWSNFDDSRVTSDIDEGDVVSNAAYCLYYKRKDVDFSNDKEIDDLTQGMESGRAMVGSSDDAASHDDMEIETSNHSPSLVSFNENQTDDMDGDSNTMLLDTNETHNYPPQ